MYSAPVIVLSEVSPDAPATSSERDLAASTEAARLAGCRVYAIPGDFSRCGSADDALWHVPVQTAPMPGWWIGYIPTAERYAAIYEAALRRNIRLLNDPDEHATILELDRAAARLGELTPATRVVTALEECASAAEALGFPLFVKGAVQSRKANGLQACVAEDLAQLEQLCAGLLSGPPLRGQVTVRGRVMVRTFVPLRHVQHTGAGFPVGREYRVVLHRGEVLAHGYYWDGDDPLRDLSRAEEAAMLAVAREAARRLAVPLSGVDVGQAEDGRWIVIETNDPQFSGTSQLPRLELWHRVAGLAM